MGECLDRSLRQRESRLEGRGPGAVKGGLAILFHWGAEPVFCSHRGRSAPFPQPIFCCPGNPLLRGLAFWRVSGYRAWSRAVASRLTVSLPESL